MRKYIRSLFFPPLPALVSLSLVFGATLFAVFYFHWESSIPAYGAYLGSAWALAAWCARGISWAKGKLRCVLERFPLISRYWNDLQFQAEVSVYFSFGLNVAYAVYKACLGAAFHSFWFGSVAAYYIILSVMRFLLLRQILKREDNREADMKRYQSCGYCLLILTFVLSIMAYTMIKNNTGSTYPGHLIYVTAGYTFYNFYLAIHNVVKYRRLNNPVISASKCISLACALVSVFTLQAAMLLNFGNDAAFQHTMNVITAAVVFTAIFILSLVMILKASLDFSMKRH